MVLAYKIVSASAGATCKINGIKTKGEEQKARQEIASAFIANNDKR